MGSSSDPMDLSEEPVILSDEPAALSDAPVITTRKHLITINPSWCKSHRQIRKPSKSPWLPQKNNSQIVDVGYYIVFGGQHGHCTLYPQILLITSNIQTNTPVLVNA
ncbi:Protein of unknown function [Pyronema omphalodes CBS 100304]|uniref:Uncharacterized protein n=1 Tax=Pyronema omphalodes (strain CBS 100304) TaxID=1076935 RepID=U4LT32_PYROM|nr:Protein of unknown function [Pyronema omphalodes CBS 100304]